MILETDFLDHWKTRWLAELLSDEMAHTYVMRLWFHCQARKTIRFDGMTGQVLKVVCRYPGDGDKLLEHMTTTGFIVIEEGAITVPKFSEVNSKMVANWENGEKRKQHFANAEANGKPTASHSEATGGAEGKVGLVGKEGIDREGGREGTTARPPVSETSWEEIASIAESSVEAYQIRRYKTPDPKASYYPQVLNEALTVFDVADPGAALSVFLKTCRAPPSPALKEKATFSDICIAAGLKKKKRNKGEVPSTPYHDVTAERLAKERAAKCTASTTSP